MNMHMKKASAILAGLVAAFILGSVFVWASNALTVHNQDVAKIIGALIAIDIIGVAIIGTAYFAYKIGKAICVYLFDWFF